MSFYFIIMMPKLRFSIIIMKGIIIMKKRECTITLE